MDCLEFHWKSCVCVCNITFCFINNMISPKISKYRDYGVNRVDIVRRVVVHDGFFSMCKWYSV